MNLYFSGHYSYWPLKMSLAMGNLAMSILYFIRYSNTLLLLFSLFYFILILFGWLKDLSREFIYKGWGSQFMLKMFKIVFILFIFSEIMFFISFFWTFFHFLLGYSEAGVFPGTSLSSPSYKFLALLNTLLLLSSGVSLTNSHLSLMSLSHKKQTFYMSWTLFLGVLFLSMQMLEYKQMFFFISEGSYASIFYLTTTFHACHVLLGWLMLFWVQMKTSPSLFLIFELASWYWHFVDVVWMFLFILYYWLIMMS